MMLRPLLCPVFRKTAVSRRSLFVMPSAVVLAGMAVTAASGWGQLSRFAPGGGGNIPTQQQPQQQESPYAGKVVEEIVAHVNDQVISKSDYDRAQEELDQEGRQQGWSQTQLMDQKRDLLRSLIDKQLLISKGKELDIDAGTQVIKRLDDIRKQNHLDSMDALQKAVESQGTSFEDFKEQIRESIITSSVISQEVGRHIQIGAGEAQQYYNTHQSEFEQPEAEKLSEILIPTADPDNATQVAEAQKKADDLEASLKAGGDFAALAKANSGGPTASQGGDLGSYDRNGGKLAKVFEDQTFDLKAGQFTEPIRTKQGLVILKVTEHTPGGLAPFKDVEDQIDEKVGYSKMEPAIREYLTKLREDAFIELRPGYVDSAATPNEVKPDVLYSAYAPPTKKKKKVERTRFRQVPRRAAKQQSASAGAAAPNGVPTLDKVNSTAATASNTKVASAKASTQKPGKKEKIRFGQAPRETLPPAETKTQDAGADTQVAANTAPANVPGVNASGANASGDVGNHLQANPDGTLSEEQQQPAKKVKTRFSAEPRKPKTDKSHPKVDPFAPETETPQDVATDKVQTAPLGLQGDTLHKKTPNPAKSGPKRRMSEEEKKKAAAPATTDNSAAPAATAPASTAPAPAPANTPQPQPQQ